MPKQKRAHRKTSALFVVGCHVAKMHFEGESGFEACFVGLLPTVNGLQSRTSPAMAFPARLRRFESIAH